MKTLLLLSLALLLARPAAWAQRPAPGSAKGPAAAAPAPTKHALIVAVGDYPEDSGWSPISSANDVPLIKAALLHQGFAEANIRVVLDAAATKAGIVAALRALATRVRPADVVVFHYSGHGQQVADDNGDETDGLDEALVPIDAPARFVAGRYEGQRHLRDDELGTLLGAVRQQLGPQGELLAVLDACHSGTGTRGLGRARGTGAALVPPGFRAPTAAAGGLRGTFGAGEGTGAGTMAPLVCYFGASPSQLNFETTDPHGNGVGSLSLAFSNALTSATTAPTYETLFDRIKAEMAASAPTQTPQVEGRTSGQVFRGRTVAVPAHYKPTAWLGERTLVIDGGALQGLHAGTQVALYPPDSEMSTAKALATGTVTASQLLTATVELTSPVAGPARPAWVVVTARTLPAAALALKLAVADPALRTQLLAALRQQPFVALPETGPFDLLLEQLPGAPPQLLTAQDQLVYRAAAKAPAAATEHLLAAIKDVARTRFIRSLNTQAEGLGVVLELVPVSVKKTGDYVQLDQQLDPASKSNGTGGLVYTAGDYLQLKLTNIGRKKAYFTVLDIQPDHQLNVLIPTARPGDEPVDYALEAGKTIILPTLLQLSPPLGQEMFKVIASAEPMDLRPLVSSRGQHRGLGSHNPFAGLLLDSYQNAPAVSRGGGAAPTLPTEAVSTSDTVFQIAAPALP